MGYKYKAHTHLAWLEKISITYLGMSVFPESVEEKKKKLTFYIIQLIELLVGRVRTGMSSSGGHK